MRSRRSSYVSAAACLAVLLVSSDALATEGRVVDERTGRPLPKVGALGPHGAWLLAPYADLPTSVGLNTIPLETVQAAAEFCATRDFQLCVHAIGDRANRETLDIFETALKKYPSSPPRRWRIEHAQVVNPDELSLFKKYSIIPSIQATHATSGMYWAGDRLGKDRIGWAYAYKNLLDQNGWIINGTDFPIENISPLLTFYASVARKDLKGQRRGFNADKGPFYE